MTTARLELKVKVIGQGHRSVSTSYGRGNAVTRSVWPRSSNEVSFSSYCMQLTINADHETLHAVLNDCSDWTTLQVAGGDPFVASSMSARSRPNVTVLGSTDPPLVPSGVTPSPANPFVTTSAPASAGWAASDPFAKLATGLLNATPQSRQPGKGKTDKSDFFPEPPKPSLLHLGQQQQQQHRERSDDVRQLEQQQNVDVFGATPV